MTLLLKLLERLDKTLTLFVIVLLLISAIVLKSIAPQLFPEYYLVIIGSFVIYILLSNIPFEIYQVFSPYFYLISIILLVFSIILGQVTRGTVRWINIGSFNLQPSEIIRPFLFLYFAFFFSKHPLSLISIAKSFVLFGIPFFLILVQPSLTVALLTAFGFLGVLISVGFSKKLLLGSVVSLLLLLPLIYLFLAPYQKQRIITFLNPSMDPYGAGYNTIQSVITIGSGGLFGKGLGRGTQTQLSFLPERQTDFFIASLAEELGFVGVTITGIFVFLLLFRISTYIKNPFSPTSRAFLTAFYLSTLVQVTVNIGMNLGLTPVAGIPLPLLSAGGSSLLATMISLSIAQSGRKV